MRPESPRTAGNPPLALGPAVGYASLAIASFHAAFTWPRAASLIAVYLYSLYQLSGLATSRRSFYFGLVTGVACFAPQLHFFWTIFGPAAVALWVVLGFWIGAFTGGIRICRSRFGDRAAVWLAPVLWIGLEYFRSELYYLRFSWFSAGYALAGVPNVSVLRGLGVYGVGGLLVMAAAGLSLLAPWPRRALGGLSLALLHLVLLIPPVPSAAPLPRSSLIRIAGIQAEFPAAFEVPAMLDQLIRQHPRAPLLVLSEYTFDGPVPQTVKDWCRRHRRYLVAGGKQFLDATHFLNTAFVVGPEGKVIYRQAKSVPIQFFNDGQPALNLGVWESPWGKVGLCVCYDLSYRRVVDRLVQLGAQTIIVPTMDVLWWGVYEHVLHARVAPTRAAELGLPIFRLSSSGFSQAIDQNGRLLAEAPCPGDRASLSALLSLPPLGYRPADRFLGPLAAGVVVLLVGAAVFHPGYRTWKRLQPPALKAAPYSK